MLNMLILFHYMHTSYHGARGGDDPTEFTNFSITNSDCKDSGTGINAGGLSEKHIQKANFVNVTVVKAGKALEIENVDDFVFEGAAQRYAGPNAGPAGGVHVGPAYLSTSGRAK